MSERAMMSLQRGQLWTVARGVQSLGVSAGGAVLIVQNDPYNRNPSYPWTIVAAIGITSSDVPTHVPFQPQDVDALDQDAGVRCERMGCIRKEWLQSCLGMISAPAMARIESAIHNALGL